MCGIAGFWHFAKRPMALFVDNFQPSGSEISHEERTPVAL